MKRSLLFLFTFLITDVVLAQDNDFYNKLSEAAISIINPSIVYDPAYTKILYPNGDVASNKGVCTDVIIRAYRKLGVDLQKEVHEDMRSNFSKYSSKRIWGLSSTNRNIDHRRVPNLQTFFKRKGTSLPVSTTTTDYRQGDIVTWDLGKGLTHIGIVIDQKTKQGIPLVVHNIGKGQIAEDILFKYKITGHYRYHK